MHDIFILFVAGMLAGVLGGLLGIGGGIVILPFLRFEFGLSPAFASANCVVAVFFTALGGSYRHFKLGHVQIRPILPVILSGAVFTILFSLLFKFLAHRERWLDLGIGLVFSLIAVRMLTGGIREWQKSRIPGATILMPGRMGAKIGLGSVAGILPGLFGIGTGAILVPAFHLILNTFIKTAVGASLTCFAINAFISAIFKMTQGFVYLPMALPLSVGTVVGANLGAMLNNKLHSATLKIFFSLVFMYVAIQFVLSFAGGKL